MGVGGAGCSAAFAIASSQGFQVTGCDIEKTSPYLDKRLKKFVSIGHDPAHLKNSEVIAYSPAVTSFDSDNEELVMARKRGLEVLPWDLFVAKELLKNKFVIAVAGTHGKSTVTAMVGVLLEKAGIDPTCLVGAIVVDWGCNYRVGESKYFVIEADEYSEKFLNFTPNIAAITNIEFDHPEYFRDFDHLKETFKKFADKLQEDSVLIVGSDVNLKNNNGKTNKVSGPADLNLKMVGGFNQKNAAIAAAVAQELGIEKDSIKKTLESFKGVARRFEFIGEEKGVLVFDDYAHHPTAISETLRAVREKFPDKKILVVFQPHLFTRTKVLFDDFVRSFTEAPVDKIILVDIFAAREKDEAAVSSLDLTRAIVGGKAKYIPSLEGAATYLVKEVSVGDVVITMGAGDIYRLPTRLLEKLEGKG
ncbi:MAG: hypothetical protein A2Z11_00485 [Candidatus Woykebacteria bacterium RBG_16_43_9]|uniref:UDP-N-acetylmuramate--L-alanine ligase n=1 Tax=Candidatus Woykebacteria bacterium RBG_16_43_9 TaxID=1802596 RepID=A0A1G1WEX9_9BACT|nr:MAG: hypothetical protein A2Z11_00485 [Candidatus Woykebacteria bacterium RBG_16_43_9]